MPEAVADTKDQDRMPGGEKDTKQEKQGYNDRKAQNQVRKKHVWAEEAAWGKKAEVAGSWGK